MDAWAQLPYCLVLAVALAACAGLRAWLPLLSAGVMARAGMLHLGDGFKVLADDRALLLFGLATLIELAGDKVPAVDHALDALSTLVRPLAGSVLAASALWPVNDPLLALALGVAIGAPAALVPHAAKSSLRVVSSAFTFGLANPVISLVEDLLALLLVALAILVPILVVLAWAVTAYFVLRRVLRPSRPVPGTA